MQFYVHIFLSVMQGTIAFVSYVFWAVNITYSLNLSDLRRCITTGMYKVVQIWLGQTVTCLHTISPGHSWTTLYKNPPI